MVMTYYYRCLLPAITPHPLTPPLHGHGDPASAGQVGTGGEAVCHWQERRRLYFRFIIQKLDRRSDEGFLWEPAGCLW
jgi:hypothetical protein